MPGPKKPAVTAASDCGCQGGLSHTIITAGGAVRRVDHVLTGKDLWGALKMRLGIGRNRYKVAPGLYAIGNPNEHSPVFVSANYKLSFDQLRQGLAGLGGWVLGLATPGVHVWG